MKRLLSILNIEFLIKENAFKNWRMIIFLSALALIMIASGHSAEQKIFRIATLNEEIKALKSQFIEQKEQLLHLKKETTVIQKLSSTGLGPANEPPILLLVTKKKADGR